MKDFDQDYYFIRWNEGQGNLPILTPDVNTNERRYVANPPLSGSAPLIFTNGFKDEFKQRGVKDFAADILFEGSHFIVRDHIRERLLQLDLPGVHLHPAVYIDDSANWHEDYWFVGVTKELDCWDHDKSTCAPQPIVIGDSVRYSVYEYVLDTKKINDIPLNERLLFQMGGTTSRMITCHKSITAIFSANGKSGATLELVVDH